MNAKSLIDDESSSALPSLVKDWRLTKVLIQREIEARYRGSVLGILWSFITPLLMLGVYTFVFGTIFQARWTAGEKAAATGEYAVILFAGLIVYNIFAETINRAPALILGNVNYVKKVVFPLRVLVPVALGNALFHGIIGFTILLPFIMLVFGSLPWTVVLAPLVLLPFLLAITGLGWFLASIGTYARDISQFINTMTTTMLFLAPIFFPRTILPEWARPLMSLNPVTIPVEEMRKVLVLGEVPDWTVLGIYSLCAGGLFALGHLWFAKTEKGFADVV